VRFIFSALTLVVVIAAVLFFAGPLLFSAGWPATFME